MSEPFGFGPLGCWCFSFNSCSWGLVVVFRAPIWSNKELHVTENLRRTLNQTLETEVLSGSWDLVTKALAPVKKQLMFREGGGLDFLFLKRTFF